MSRSGGLPKPSVSSMQKSRRVGIGIYPAGLAPKVPRCLTTTESIKDENSRESSGAETEERGRCFPRSHVNYTLFKFRRGKLKRNKPGLVGF
jgi:hypothetical protein